MSIQLGNNIMKHLKKFHIDKTMTSFNDNNRQKIVEFIKKNENNLSRVYYRDYMEKYIDIFLLRMLGFTVITTNTKSNTKIRHLFCYEDEFQKLNELISTLE